MENEVIIDGCNVAACEHLLFDGKRKPICKSGGSCRVYKSCLCVDNSDCHFKQLQRAKAELEQYKIKYPIIDCYRCKNSQENKVLKAENEKLKEWLENKEKAYNHLCNANARKKEQIKNLNYMLFEEKEMTTQEWKLKYRLANKERKFIQYKEITNKRLNNYKQALEEIRDMAKYDCEYKCSYDYTVCKIKRCLEQRIMRKINEVLNK